MPDTFEAFRADARVLGFPEALVRTWAANTVLDTHPHPFDARALLVDGEMWLTLDGRTLASHSGGDPGTDAVTCLDRGAGTAMFCVANVSGGPALRALQKDIVLRELAAA